MPKIEFTTKDNEYHLEVARHLTGSLGWRKDALAVAGYDPNYQVGDGQRLRGVMVLQNFDGFGVDIHFALAPGRAFTRRLIESVVKFTFHPSWQNQPMARAFIAENNTDAIYAALHLGFKIQCRVSAGVFTAHDAIILTLQRDDVKLWTPPSNATSNGSE